MITFYKNPFYEIFTQDCLLLPTVIHDLGARQSSPRSFVPLLIGVVRKDGLSEIVKSDYAYAMTMQNTEFLSVDLYAYDTWNAEFGHTFRYVTRLVRFEDDVYKKDYINTFNAEDECARVRFVLDALKNGKPLHAGCWLNRCIAEPVTEKNLETIVEIARRLTFNSCATLTDRALAKAYLKNIFRVFPNNPEAQVLLADMYRLGVAGGEPDFKKAKVLVAKAIEQNRMHSGALTTLGYIYMHGGYGIEQDLNLAERYFLKATVDAKNLESRIGLGNLYSMRSVYFYPNAAESVRYLKQAAALDAKDTGILEKIAALYHFGGDLLPPNGEEAKKYYEQILVLDPMNDNASIGIKDINKNPSRAYSICPMQSLRRISTEAALQNLKVESSVKAAVEGLKLLSAQMAAAGKTINDLIRALKE
jgi:tetratricopeptide (TPR) repeat protein